MKASLEIKSRPEDSPKKWGDLFHGDVIKSGVDVRMVIVGPTHLPKRSGMVYYVNLQYGDLNTVRADASLYDTTVIRRGKGSIVISGPEA